MIANMTRTLKWMMCFLCISLSACITEDEEMESGNNLEVGDRIPSFSVMMNDGSVLSASVGCVNNVSFHSCEYRNV